MSGPRDKLRDKVQCLLGNSAKVQEDLFAAVAVAVFDYLRWLGPAHPSECETLSEVRLRMAELAEFMKGR